MLLQTLHDLIIGRRWSSVRSRLQTQEGKQNAATPSLRSQQLPLHLACIHGAPPLIIQILLTVHPQSAWATDGMGCLPLHYECLKRARVQVVKALLEVYEEGARVANGYGCLPVHLACFKASTCPIMVVEALLSAYPAGARITDRKGCLPIHYAVLKSSAATATAATTAATAAAESPQVGTCTTIVLALLQEHPLGAATLNQRGCLPIHYVSGTPEAMAAVGDDVEEEENPVVKAEVTRALMDAYPDGARIPDGAGWSWSRMCLLRGGGLHGALGNEVF